MESRAPDRQAEVIRLQRRRLVFSSVVATVLIAALLIVDFSGSEDQSSEPEQPETPVVVIPNSAIDRLPTRGDEQLVLEGAHEIDSGDFITTEVGPNAREGFLLKALSVEESDDQTTVDTKPASLFDAVPSGSLVANPSDFRRVELPASTEQTGHLIPAAFRRETWLLDRRPHLECEEQAEELALKPFFTREFEPVFSMRWNDGKKWWKKRIETADAGIRGELGAVVRGSARGTFKCVVKPALVIPLFAAVVPAGPVPVPLHVHATVEPTVGASVEGRIEVEVGVDGYAGVEYDSRKLTPKGALVPRVSGTPPPRDLEASGGVGVTPAIKVVAGWRTPVLGELTASARISLPTEVRLSYEPLAEAPLPKACLGLGVKGTIRFNLPPPVRWFPPAKSAEKKLLDNDKCLTFGGEDERSR